MIVRPATRYSLGNEHRGREPNLHSYVPLFPFRLRPPALHSTAFSFILALLASNVAAFLFTLVDQVLTVTHLDTIQLKKNLQFGHHSVSLSSPRTWTLPVSLAGPHPHSFSSLCLSLYSSYA